MSGNRFANCVKGILLDEVEDVLVTGCAVTGVPAGDAAFEVRGGSGLKESGNSFGD